MYADDTTFNLENFTQQNLNKEINCEIKKNNTWLKVVIKLTKDKINDIPQKTKTYPKYKHCN